MRSVPGCSCKESHRRRDRGVVGNEHLAGVLRGGDHRSVWFAQGLLGVRRHRPLVHCSAFTRDDRQGAVAPPRQRGLWSRMPSAWCSPWRASCSPCRRCAHGGGYRVWLVRWLLWPLATFMVLHAMLGIIGDVQQIASGASGALTHTALWDLALWSPLFLIWGLLWAATAMTYATRARTPEPGGQVGRGLDRPRSLKNRADRSRHLKT